MFTSAGLMFWSLLGHCQCETFQNDFLDGSDIDFYTLRFNLVTLTDFKVTMAQYVKTEEVLSSSFYMTKCVL